MVSVEANGTIVFTTRQPKAEQVELVGAFDSWHEKRLPMQRGEDGLWRLTVNLGSGEHLFRYLLNGCRWVLDESAHGIRIAADGSERSRVWCPPLALDPDNLAA